MPSRTFGPAPSTKRASRPRPVLPPDGFGPTRDPATLDPDTYPDVSSLGAGFFYRFLPHPLAPLAPEYVYLRRPSDRARDADAPSPGLVFDGFVSQWNTAWEADHLRADLFHEAFGEVRHIPELARLERLVHATRLPAGHADAGKPTVNLAPVPQVGRSRLTAYMTIYRLLPLPVLTRFGLPPVPRGLWPFSLGRRHDLRYFPADAESRLARAFAYHVWPLLGAGARLGALAADEPLTLLAHNLDFWMPHVEAVAQARASAYGRVEPDDPGPQGARPETPGRLEELRAQMPPGYTADRPFFGGIAWRGPEDAWKATAQVVERADGAGRLRGLIDAVRAHRVEEDFAPRWSWAREDFERRLHRKRDKVRVTFVQLDDTTPVHGPWSEYGGTTADGVPAAAADRLLWEDFLALLDPKERRIVVCLRSGATSLGDVARQLGYANHSPVSKALARIRRRTRALLDDGE